MKFKIRILQCKICNEKKELRNSHIIPEFMYQYIYDSKPKRFYGLKINSSNSKKTFHQKGIRQKLFCQNCETKLSKYEKYAAKVLYAKNNDNQAYKAEESKNRNSYLSKFQNIKYKEFKIFLMSILYRILITNDTARKKVADEKIEKLRNAIFDENPMEFNDFGCCIQNILYKENERVDKLILIEPYNSNPNINVLIDGFMYTFLINSQHINHLGSQECLLKEDGTMTIIGRFILDDKALLETLKHFNNEFK